jgi:hypothetical protein
MATLLSGEASPQRLRHTARVTRARTLASALAKSRALPATGEEADPRLTDTALSDAADVISRRHRKRYVLSQTSETSARTEHPHLGLQPAATPSHNAPTLEEAELTRRLAEALSAMPSRRPQPQPDPPRPHVSLSSPPEVVAPIVFVAVDDVPVPPPLPVTSTQLVPTSLASRPGLPAVVDDDWLDDAIEADRTATGPLDAPWLKRGRRTRQRQPGTIMAWLITVIVVIGAMGAAMVGLIGGERVFALGAEVGDFASELWSAMRAFVSSRAP